MNPSKADAVDCGCDYCLDDQNRWYGHVEQVGTHATESLLLLRCPRCRALYEMDGLGAQTSRLTLAEAQERYPHVALDRE
jgi:hypothetical protein